MASTKISLASSSPSDLAFSSASLIDLAIWAVDFFRTSVRRISRASSVVREAIFSSFLTSSSCFAIRSVPIFSAFFCSSSRVNLVRLTSCSCRVSSCCFWVSDFAWASISDRRSLASLTAWSLILMASSLASRMISRAVDWIWARSGLVTVGLVTGAGAAGGLA